MLVTGPVVTHRRVLDGAAEVGRADPVWRPRGRFPAAATESGRSTKAWAASSAAPAAARAP